MRSQIAHRHSINNPPHEENRPRHYTCCPARFPELNPPPYSMGARTKAPNSFSKRSFFPSCSKTEPAGVSSSTGIYSPQRGHETICTTVRTSAPSARPRRNLTPAQLLAIDDVARFRIPRDGYALPSAGTGERSHLIAHAASPSSASSFARSKPTTFSSPMKITGVARMLALWKSSSRASSS